jgi:hypothetical protein
MLIPHIQSLTIRMVEVTGKIKSFSIRTQRVCRKCGNTAKASGGEYYSCKNCGGIHYKQTKRRWFAVGSIDVFERDFQAVFSEKAVSQLLEKISVSWRNSMDRLQGLKGTAWFETWKILAKEIDAVAATDLIGKGYSFYGKQLDENTIEVRKIGGISGTSREVKIGERFVGGTVQELTEIAEEILPEYTIDFQLWVETPVVYFTRFLEGIHIVIGLRAPVGQYGKSYKIWMRANGIHMYPSTPKKVKNNLEWVFSFNHTIGWKDKLRKNLKYCKSMEEQLVKVVKAAGQLQAERVTNILQDLPTEVREEISKRWNGGSLWLLVETAGTIDRAAGIQILKKAGFLNEEGLPPT